MNHDKDGERLTKRVLELQVEVLSDRRSYKHFYQTKITAESRREKIGRSRYKKRERKQRV